MVAQIELVPQLGKQARTVERSACPVGVRNGDKAGPKAFGIVGIARSENVLTVAKRVIMIARALLARARLVVLDEPTTSITDEEIKHLHGICRQIKARGGSVLYVSHRLEEILSLTDRVIVMRDGEVDAFDAKADGYVRAEGGVALVLFTPSGRHEATAGIRLAPLVASSGAGVVLGGGR